jgi:hypothetical protein
MPVKWREGRARRGISKEELTQVIVFALTVCFFTNFFIFFLPSVAFRSLHLPSLVKVPRGGFDGFFRGPAGAAWAGWSRLRLAREEIDCAYVSHGLKIDHSF